MDTIMAVGVITVGLGVAQADSAVEVLAVEVAVAVAQEEGFK